MTKNRKLWTREGINRILRNQAYIGQVAHGTRRNVLKREYDDRGAMTKKKVQIKINRKEWQVVEDAHPSLVDKEIFYKAQKILLSRTHDRGGIRRAYHPLTGVLVCGICGEGMVCQKRSSTNKEYRYYICKTYHKYGRNACHQANINADGIEKVVMDCVKEKISQLPIYSLVITVNYEHDINKLTDEIKDINSRKNKLMKDQMDIFEQRDFFSEELYRTQMIEIKTKISYLEEEVSLIEKQIDGIHEKIAQSFSLQSIIEEFKELNIGDTDRFRVLIHEMISRMTLKGNDLIIEYVYDFDS